ncbi:hypothetical protein J6590_057707 [Homalodisca vitripennis]|nr:hypothetical protein J6590_057707 [Homalodisca vitripennis]
MHFPNLSQKEKTSAYDTNIEFQPNLSESPSTSSNSRSEFCVRNSRWFPIISQAFPKGEDLPNEDYGYGIVVYRQRNQLKLLGMAKSSQQILIMRLSINVLNITSAAADTGQQKRSDPAPRERPSTRCTNNCQNIKPFGRRSPDSPTIFPRPLADLPVKYVFHQIHLRWWC